ncbi:MAG: phenylalanine--tRNA ligase alpha subunit [Candidatus Roseilinea sp.]|nr:MAG: phenylalanine--tRNA ligase alpha subunit [Candidatus Roseilinea sp.]
MTPSLDALEREALAALAQADTSAALQAWHGKYFGTKRAQGELERAMSAIASLSPAERPAFGQRANEVKQALAAAFEAKQAAVKEAELEAAMKAGALDVTLPGTTIPRGRLHPSTLTLRRIIAIFARMGFEVYRSPEVETDEMNFGLLNMPPEHPARDMWDTFYTTQPGVLLRTHTSPGQIRVMRERSANGTQPIRVILPGMVYRYEQVTARSEMQFNQVEGLAIGRAITFADLKGVMAEFARRMFGSDTRIRFRCSYFPFTEPSVEVDVYWGLATERDRMITKGTGWLEIAGAGMVHPTVLRNGGYDPAEWSGFAFGMGPERQAMRLLGISDIRYFWQNDLRFLEQF